MMTLPAVSVPAIKVFAELFGKWQQSATVVINGNLVPVIAASKPPEISRCLRTHAPHQWLYVM